MVIDGIQKVVATDHCMAVCCTDLAMFRMDGRWNVREMLTKGLVATEWPEDQKSLMKNYGKRENLAKATMEVEVAQLISNDQHASIMMKTANLIALPPMEIKGDKVVAT